MTNDHVAEGAPNMLGAHLGLRVKDLDEAMARLSRVAGLRWSEVLDWDAPYYKDGELRTERVRFVMSIDGPPHFELMESRDGIFATDADEDFHHYGRWVFDYDAEKQTLLADGYTEELRGEDDEGRVRYAYFVKEGHVRLELCAMTEHENFERWTSGGTYAGTD